MKDDKVYISTVEIIKTKKTYCINQWFSIDEFLSLSVSNKDSELPLDKPGKQYTIHGDKNIIGVNDKPYLNEIIKIKNGIIKNLMNEYQGVRI